MPRRRPTPRSRSASRPRSSAARSCRRRASPRLCGTSWRARWKRCGAISNPRRVVSRPLRASAGGVLGHVTFSSSKAVSTLLPAVSRIPRFGELARSGGRGCSRSQDGRGWRAAPSAACTHATAPSHAAHRTKVQVPVAPRHHQKVTAPSCRRSASRSTPPHRRPTPPPPRRRVPRRARAPPRRRARPWRRARRRRRRSTTSRTRSAPRSVPPPPRPPLALPPSALLEPPAPLREVFFCDPGLPAQTCTWGDCAPPRGHTR